MLSKQRYQIKAEPIIENIALKILRSLSNVIVINIEYTKCFYKQWKYGFIRFNADRRRRVLILVFDELTMLNIKHKLPQLYQNSLHRGQTGHVVDFESDEFVFLGDKFEFFFFL